jgi:cytochrome P450
VEAVQQQAKQQQAQGQETKQQEAPRQEAKAHEAGARIAALLGSLVTPAVSANPYPVFAQLRDLGPVRWKAAGGVPVLTGYEDCAALVRDQEFGSQSPEWCDQVTPGWREHPARVATFEAMLFRDPPDHTRLRRLVSAAFTPRQAERMRGDVAGLCTRTLDQLADAGGDGSLVDLHDFLAARLPIAVIASLVGVPEADWPLLRGPMSALLKLVELGITKQMVADADAAAITLDAYFRELAADRRASPGPDLASTIVAAQHASRPGADAFTDLEVVQLLIFLFMAGVDTMTNLLANGTLALLASPQQARLVADGAVPLDNLVDEVLRYDTPVQLVGRVAAIGKVIGDVEVRPGEVVLAMIGAGNRDPARFERPDSFDVTRKGTAPLSFGGGIHRCLGAPLARVEAGEFLTGLFRRFPKVSLAGEPVRQGVVFRGFSYLPITLR